MRKNLLLFSLLTTICLFGQTKITNLFSQTLTEKDKVDLLISHENYKQALEKLRQLISSDSLDPELFYRKGLTEQFLYQNINALSSFKKALSLDTSNAAYYYSRARSYSAIGSNNEALNDYKIAFKKDPDNINGALSYSSYLISLEMYNEAGEVYGSLLKYDSLNSSLYSKIAFCHFKSDSLNLAVENYQKAIALNDMDLNDVQQLVILYISLKKTAIADSILDIKLLKFPKTPGLIRLKGDVKYKSMDFMNAIKYYTQAIGEGDKENYVLPKLGLSYFYYANENDSMSYNEKTVLYEKAKEAFETYLVKDKDNPLVTYFLGVIFSKLGEYNKAITYLGKSLDLAIPSFSAEAYGYLGECYRMLKQYDSAAVSYKMSLVFNSDNELVMDNIFFLYYHTLNDYKGLQSYLSEFLLANKDIKDEMKKIIKERLTYIDKTTGKPINKPVHK